MGIKKQQLNNPLFTENNKNVQNYFSRRELLVNRRNKVSIVEIAEAYRDEIERRGLTQKQLADELGVSRVRVTQILNVLKLPEEVLEKVRRDPEITERRLRNIN